MQVPFEFSRVKLILLCLLLVWLIYSTVFLIMGLAGSNSENREDDSLAEATFSALIPLLCIVQIVVNARHLRRVPSLSNGAIRDGKHCPHCGSDVGVLAVAWKDRKIRCPYCRSQLDYQGKNVVMNLVMGSALLLLAVIYVLLAWPTSFWRDSFRYGLFLFLLLGIIGIQFLAALYLRAKRVLILSSPPPVEDAAPK